MSAQVSTIEIARPPEQVFAYLTDPTKFPEWQDDVVSVRVDGAKFTTTRKIGGSNRTMTQEITENNPPTSWAARGIDGPIRPSARLTVEPLGGGMASRVTIALDFEGHGLGKVLLPMVRRAAEKGAPLSYQKLKARLEQS
jgi:uncharacterized protein YndB with AHSA1/START domain